nr:MAG TPA: hypothetical protein [Caudoviricetes sp.]
MMSLSFQSIGCNMINSQQPKMSPPTHRAM